MNPLQLIQPPQMFKDLNFHVHWNKTQGAHVITIYNRYFKLKKQIEMEKKLTHGQLTWHWLNESAILWSKR